MGTLCCAQSCMKWRMLWCSLSCLLHVKVAPTWMNLSLAIFHDEETAKEWGWVQVRSVDVLILHPCKISTAWLRAGETLGESDRAKLAKR